MFKSFSPSQRTEVADHILFQRSSREEYYREKEILYLLSGNFFTFSFFAMAVNISTYYLNDTMEINLNSELIYLYV